VTFSGDMNPGLTEVAFAMDPTVTGAFAWSSGNVMVFTPDAGLKHSTEYTITLHQSAVDVNGNPLVDDYVCSFTTEPLLLPEVTTGEASGVTAYAATLNGSLGSLGDHQSMDVSFEWGETPCGPYPNKTVPETMAAPGAFDTTIEGLSLGTTYYFRAKAVGSNAVCGSEKSFTALRAADVVLLDGWNIVALTLHPATDYTASTLAADINSQGGGVTQVFWWNAAGGTWDFYLVDSQYGSDFDIELGQGYLMKNLTSVTWTYWGRYPSSD